MGTSKIHPTGTPNARQFLETVLETKWLYLLLNFFTVSVPLIRSFEPRIAYYKSFGTPDRRGRERHVAKGARDVRKAADEKPALRRGLRAGGSHLLL